MTVTATVGRALSVASEQRQVVEAVEALRNNLSAGEITLTTGATTTTLTDTRIGPNSFIGFTPLDANAAGEIGGGTLYISARAAGTATITHANAGTTRLFSYCVLGR